MGASLAKVVLSAAWGHLPPGPRVLFAHMAVTARDDDRPPVYFAGRDALVLALFGFLDERPAERDQQYRRVRRALDQLKRAGAIAAANSAHTRRRAEYRLHVLRSELAVTQRPPVGAQEEVTQRPPQEVTQRPPVDPRGGHSVVKEEVTQRPPKEEGGTTTGEDLPGGGIDRVSGQPHLGAREGRQSKPERCAECGRPEQQCRARSAHHGGHRYRPVELATARLP